MLRPPETDKLAASLKAKYIDACPKCRQTGKLIKPVPGAPWDYTTEPCECAKTVRYKLGLRRARIPREFVEVLDVMPERNMDRFAVVQQYVKDLRAHFDEGDGFLFYGLNGAGKTMFSCYILANAIRAGYSAIYMTAKEYAAACGQARSDWQFRAWFQEIILSSFLVLDELGKEYRSGNEYSLAELDDLLRTRRGAKLPTVICTNMSLHEFRDGYGASFFSLTKGSLEHLAFEASTDFRDVIKGRKNAKV